MVAHFCFTVLHLSIPTSCTIRVISLVPWSVGLDRFHYTCKSLSGRKSKKQKFTKYCIETVAFEKNLTYSMNLKLSAN